MNQNHIMLDIETLGDESNSIITSIGAIQFDIKNGNNFQKFHRYIDIKSSYINGLKMTPDTILWWLSQSDAARKELITGNNNAVSLSSGLDDFAKWLKFIPKPFTRDFYKSEDLYIWGRGPRFDMAILADSYRTLNLEIPWNTRKELCVRTMEFLNPDIKQTTIKTDVGHGSDGMGTHNALLDCKYQIRYVSEIFNKSTSILFNKS